MITLIFLINLITAFFSSGYYHTDEHMQILEFANYKLGHNPASNMPNEFFSKMRSWLLPGFYFLSYKIIHIISPNLDNFIIATTSRDNTIKFWNLNT